MIKQLRNLSFVLLFVAVTLTSVQANQSSGCLPTSSLPGLTLVNTLNAWMKSISTMFSGTAAPITDCSGVTLTGQLWLDSATSGYLKQKLYDGTSSIETGRYDTTNHWWVPPIGGGTATLSSSTTTDLWSVPQAAVTVSGTTTITALANASAVPGTSKKVTFSGALLLTHNGTSLILPTATNITTAVGDTAEVEAVSSTNVRVRNYQRADGTSLSSLPSGTIVFNASASTPAGWLPCDGAAVSRTTYAGLYATISVTYGAGNGTTTFNVPDVGGRVIAGKEVSATRLTSAVSGVDGGTLAAAGGAQSQTLTALQTPVLAGTGNVNSGADNFVVTDGTTVAHGTGSGGAVNVIDGGTNILAVNSLVVNSTGGAAHPIVQPTIILNCLIKTEIPTLTNYAGIKIPFAFAGFDYGRVGKDVNISAFG
jgi:microcystin-dependent protein